MVALPDPTCYAGQADEGYAATRDYEEGRGKDRAHVSARLLRFRTRVHKLFLRRSSGGSPISQLLFRLEF